MTLPLKVFVNFQVCMDGITCILENIEDLHDDDTEECLEDYVFVDGEDVENKIVLEEDDDLNNNSKLGNSFAIKTPCT